MQQVLVLVAVCVLGALADISSLQASYNGSFSIGTLAPGKRNQTAFNITADVTGIPLSSIWIYFADAGTLKPIPSTSFQHGSLALTSGNASASVYTALTTSLGVTRSFDSYPLVIPKGTLTLRASWTLNTNIPVTDAVIAWTFVSGTAGKAYAQHATILVAEWKGTGKQVHSITTSLPYDSIIAWGIGNIYTGGQIVTLTNNATGALICKSAVTVTGDMNPCSPSAALPGGTKVTVTTTTNSTITPDSGGMDLYIVRVPSPTTTATHSTTANAAASTAHATATAHATSAHATATTAAATSHAAATAHAAAATATHAAAATAATHAASIATTHAASGATSHAGSSAGGPSGPAGSSTGGSHTASSASGGSTTHSAAASTQTNTASTQSDSTQGSTQSGSTQSTGGATLSGSTQSTQSAGSTDTAGSTTGYTNGAGNGNDKMGGFLSDFDSIFSGDSKDKARNKKTTIIINDIKDKQPVVEITEIDDLPNNADHLRITEEKASQKFIY